MKRGVMNSEQVEILTAQFLEIVEIALPPAKKKRAPVHESELYQKYKEWKRIEQQEKEELAKEEEEKKVKKVEAPFNDKQHLYYRQ